ncbi:MAG: type II toxin-antitoxin system PemK/MazF family toxin [Oscillospiraceae bacterium]|jgi:mRNA-degrading endonuclease toxin of MazEF toxin-antitoxin module|nr:type II toxin-antitoxin system PemK/MazF family toxin [Oscillospiraceae bacterium]
MPLEVIRGEMYFADITDSAFGNEQRGYRPVLVVQTRELQHRFAHADGTAENRLADSA